MQPSSNHNNFLIRTIFASQNFCIFDYSNNMLITSYPKLVRFLLASIIYFLLQIPQNIFSHISLSQIAIYILSFLSSLLIWIFE